MEIPLVFTVIQEAGFAPCFSENSLLDILNRLPYLADRASRENNQKTTIALGKDVRRAYKKT